MTARKRTMPVFGDSLSEPSDIGAAAEAVFATTAQKMNGAAQKVEAAIRSINEARSDNKKLQGQFAVGSPSWHACEVIDDSLFDALSSLGD